MYKVYCRADKKYSKWVEYSKEFETIEEAESCKQIAESRCTYDVNDNEIVYKIKTI